MRSISLVRAAHAIAGATRRCYGLAATGVRRQAVRLLARARRQRPARKCAHLTELARQSLPRFTPIGAAEHLPEVRASVETHRVGRMDGHAPRRAIQGAGQARVIAPGLGDALGQPVIVENRPGAAGIVGMETVAKSPADGHTVFLGATGNITINPAVYRSCRSTSIAISRRSRSSPPCRFWSASVPRCRCAASPSWRATPSMATAPTFADAVPMARALIAAAPDRILGAAIGRTSRSPTR
jgi:hypothetical protein